MPVRYVLNRLKRFFVYRVLHVDDTPHRIALGLAIGIFVTWTPTIGLQMLLTIALSWLLRANKAVGVPFVWISNPLTVPPIYGPNYLVGCWILGGDYDWHRFWAFAKAVASGGSWIERFNAGWQAMLQIFWPLWLGSIVVGLILGTMTYFATRFAVVKYREHWHRRHPDPPWKHHVPASAKPKDETKGPHAPR
jgi:uncharacterized protein (DUF2062 family)